MANNIDWTQPLREGDLARAKIAAQREAQNALAWRRRAEDLERKLMAALKGQHMAVTRKEAWKRTAKQLWDRLFVGQNKGTDELVAMAKTNFEEVDKAHPWKGPV